MAVHIQRFGAAGGRGFQTVIKHSCVVAMLAAHTGMVWSRYSFTILAAKILVLF